MVAAVLSGGENTRMPVLKGFIEVQGRRLIERQVELLKGIFENVVISANSPELYFYLGVPVVGDVRRGGGPMVGILSLLLGTGAEQVFVLACDMPFVNKDLVRRVAALRGGDAAAAMFNGRPEPLIARYSSSIIRLLDERTKQGRAGLTDMLSEIDTRYVPEQEVREIDPKGSSFVNINTTYDFESAFGAGTPLRELDMGGAT